MPAVWRLRALARLAPAPVALAATSLAAAGAILAVCAGAGGASAAPPSPHAAGAPTIHQLLRSRELWATIDICNAPDQPNTVGIRGSMPGDGKTADKMYMEFGLEYIDAVNQWAALPSSSSGWVLVGSGSGARQGGWSFTLKPPNSRGKFTLRGTVTFRWMRGGTRQLARTTLPTTAGRKVLAGADPAGFSAARCDL
ncbi:MAG TPA: hypothetical protein VMB91_05250 [Solirubrobacteraceae bacterium]|nr:hypothetical protein [Solirubrobacteraceae bacterium]